MRDTIETSFKVQPLVGEGKEREKEKNKITSMYFVEDIYNARRAYTNRQVN